MVNQQCIESYQRLKNLKLVSKEIGMPWQTVYTHLRRAGIPVTGDKARYGCVKDRIASYAERLFKEDVPEAIDANETLFQAAIDFTYGHWSIDVKSATLLSHHSDAARWGFCINRQKNLADFFVMYAFDDMDKKNVVHVLLLPNEVATTKSLISLPATMNSKWADYEVKRSDLAPFFASLPGKEQS